MGACKVSDISNQESSAINELLLESLLEEQQTLRTPVALFSEAYARALPATRFSHLIPLSKPQPGEQYGFDVDLDACTGCKACVAACHSLNGLDDNESWRDTGVLVGTRRHPYLQTVTTACHHCADPACLNGCPVLAYAKDEITGIVRHLDDQCIGCSYCIMKCPYEVPKFNLKRGIVRKCDMCQGRLAEGEAPACVQACPNEAIKIRTVRLDAVPDRGSIIAGAFDSSYTRPTTRYASKRPAPAHVKPADASRLDLDHAHEPLAWMLVLTQMSAGAFIACALASWLGALDMRQAGITSAIALLIGLIGINLSVLHLGQPLKAWRVFLGWRRSWLSREILAFGAFAAAGTSIIGAWFVGDWNSMRLAITATALMGSIAVICSVMVYADTRRPFWSLPITGGKFIGTMLLLGSGLCAVSWSWQFASAAPAAMGCALALRWIVSLWETRLNARALDNEDCTWHKSALILNNRLPHLARTRGILLVVTGSAIPLLVLGGLPLAPLITLSVLLTIGSQLMERSYFFTAAAGSKMPGN